MAAQNNDEQRKDGGNVADKAPNAIRYPVAPFQGRSGTPDNQDTNRPAGKT